MDTPGRVSAQCGGERERMMGVWAAHLDDERVLKHGIPHDPQPLVLHARPDVGHGQGPPRGWADLADRAAHRLLLPSHEVLAGALCLRHPEGRGVVTRGLNPARFPAWGLARSSEDPTASPGRHHPGPGVDDGRRTPSRTGSGNVFRPFVARSSKCQYKPLWFLRASSVCRAEDWEKREKSRPPLKEERHSPSPWKRDANGSGAVMGSCFFQETIDRHQSEPVQSFLK